MFNKKDIQSKFDNENWKDFIKKIINWMTVENTEYLRNKKI